jgi:hypothetical protein
MFGSNTGYFVSFALENVEIHKSPKHTMSQDKTAFLQACGPFGSCPDAALVAQKPCAKPSMAAVKAALDLTEQHKDKLNENDRKKAEVSLNEVRRLMDLQQLEDLRLQEVEDQQNQQQSYVAHLKRQEALKGLQE